MSLNTNIDLQTVLVNLGRAYNNESSGSSIIYTINLSTGPQYSVSVARNLVSSYTTGNNPVVGTDFDILNKFSSDLRTLESEIQTMYINVQSTYLAAQFSKLSSFITSSFGTNIRSYINTPQYSSVTGSIYDVHGGFAQSYLNYNGSSLVFKLAEIATSGSYTTMIHGPLNYGGIGGLTRMVLTHFTGPEYLVSSENISTSLFTGPYNSVFEYGSTGSVCFTYIAGSSGSFRTLAYPRILNAGFNAPTGSSQNVYFQNIAFSVQHQPSMRYASAPNTMVLVAKSVVDSGDRDFVFKMVKNNTLYPTTSDVEQTKTITVAGNGDIATIIGTTGNTSFYRPFSLVSATGVQQGEIFEIWVQE